MPDDNGLSKEQLWMNFLATVRPPGVRPAIADVDDVNHHLAGAFIILALHQETAWDIAFPGGNPDPHALAARYPALNTSVVTADVLRRVAGMRQVFGDIHGAWKVFTDFYEPEPCPPVQKIDKLVEFTKTYDCP